MSCYGVEFFADSKREAEISDGDNGADFVFEDVDEKSLFIEFFDEGMVSIVSVDAVGHDTAILNIFVIGVVGTSNFEFVVIEEIGGGVDLRKCGV